jgi:F420-non-reducing hydrogenase small subunit
MSEEHNHGHAHPEHHKEPVHQEAPPVESAVPSKKPKVIMVACGGCNGCHVSFLDMHEDVLGILDAIELVRASVVADIGRRGEMPECDVALIEGAICNEDNEAIVKEVRDKAKFVISYGTCAAFGGIPGLRNFYTSTECLEEAYINADSNVDGKIPSDYSKIPRLTDYVKPVDKVIKVDFKLPGCPPPPRMIKEVLVALVSGKEPKLPTKNLCEECHRKHKKITPGDRQFLTMKIDSVMESDLDPDLCFLEQGVLCMGPATRSGCGGRCTHANMPCRGCFGPNPHAIEQGAEMSNAMAPILLIGALVNKEDLPGTFYRYALPASILPYKDTSYIDNKN